MGEQKPGKTGVYKAEPRLAPLGFSAGPPPPYREEHFTAFQDAEVAAGIWVQRPPWPRCAVCSSAPGEIGLTSVVGLVFVLLFFFFLLRTIHFGQMTRVKK